MRRGICALLLAAALATDARAHEPPDGYVPSLPVSPTRATITVLLPPTSALQGAQGEARTPRRGLVSLRLARVSDERTHVDSAGTTFRSDGEVQETTLEAVSPRLCLPWAGRHAFHVGLSVTAHSLHHAWFDGVRNFVEEDLLGPTPAVIATHDLGGRELSAMTATGKRTHLLSSAPLMRVKGYVKAPLRPLSVGGRWVDVSASAGLSSPAFGSDADSGPSSPQAEVALAGETWLARRLRAKGGASIAWVGESDRLRDLGVTTYPWSATARLALEWWFTPRLAGGLGVSGNSPLTSDPALSTSHASWYVDVGLLWRLDRRTDLHLVLSENPETPIRTTPTTDFGWAQKDADFTVTFGVRLTF
jgi:hypothetical protein